MATATRKPWTAEELERLPDGWRYEIDEGELIIMTPAAGATTAWSPGSLGSLGISSRNGGSAGR